ncbi:hypothetical protein D3C80_1042960 [compost metagenome]
MLNQKLFDLNQTALSQVHLTRFFIHGEVTFALECVGIFFFLTNQMRNDFVDFAVHIRAIFSRARNDKWGTRFIDQNGVHLIDQRIVQFTLYTFFWAKRHVVAQVVKAVFVIGTVGYIRAVGFTLSRCR